MLEPVKTFKPQVDLQTVLFETDDDGRYSNTIDLYDIAPRFVFYTDDRGAEGYLKSIKRDFEHAGIAYKLTLRPGRLIRSDGSDWEEFPGEREQIVEAVILRLASDRGKLTVMNEKVRLTFTLYEIREELRKVKHLFNIDEIKDALTILHTAIVEITRVDKKSTTVLSSSSFPVLALRKRDEGERAFLEFNPLVENAIKHLRYRHMNFSWLMRISTPLSRWLYKRLCQTRVNISSISPIVVSMTATEIARDGGIPPRSRPRDTLRYVANAVDNLIAEGVIEPGERHILKQGRKNVDIVFDMAPTPAFLDDLKRADRLEKHAREQLHAVAGTEFPDKFVTIDRSKAYGIRNERRQLTLLPGGATETDRAFGDR